MDYVTIKMLEETRRLLRLIAAHTGEQMVQVLQRLCANEWERLRADSGADRGAGSHAQSSMPQPDAE